MVTSLAAVRFNGKNFDGSKKVPSKYDAPTLQELGLFKNESEKQWLHMAWLHTRLHPYQCKRTSRIHRNHGTSDDQNLSRAKNRATGPRFTGPRIDARKAFRSSGCRPCKVSTLTPAALATCAEGAIETKETDGGNVAMFSQNLVAPQSTGPKPTLEQIQGFVEKILQVAKNVIPVSVIASPHEIAGVKVPVGTKPTGAVVDGRIYLFSDNLKSIGEAYVTLFHEVFHLGLQRVIPADDYAALATVNLRSVRTTPRRALSAWFFVCALATLPPRRAASDVKFRKSSYIRPYIE